MKWRKISRRKPREQSRPDASAGPRGLVRRDRWMLKQLFSIDALTGRLLFKGGTSLSKIFHAINRFSEDIDLAVDYVALGFKGERDPLRQDISKTKRVGIRDEMMAECRRYIGGEFLGVLKARSGEILGATDAWSLRVSEQDPNVVQFRYPTAITKSLDYVFDDYRSHSLGRDQLEGLLQRVRG
jgi:hypothetical protein